jgi:hypothetical protein
MVNYQSAVQNINAIKFGSAKIEVGETVGTLVNLGVATGIEFEETFTPIILRPDNAPEIQVGVREHYATVRFELWEIVLSNLNLIRGGIDTYSTTAASPVSVTDEAHTLNGTDFVRLDYKSGDGSEVTSITVTDASSNAAVRNTDYVIAVDPDGWTCIARIAASSVITDGEGVLVDYTYTPLASNTLTSGGKNTINPRVVRLTNTNAAGKVFRVTVYAAKNQNGITLTLPADDSEDVVQPQIELRGVVDTSRTAGDQLFEIYNEQL